MSRNFKNIRRQGQISLLERERAQGNEEDFSQETSEWGGYD